MYTSRAEKLGTTLVRQGRERLCHTYDKQFVEGGKKKNDLKKGRGERGKGNVL